MNCLYTMYVLILHHKLFMFNLIIRVRIQTDHIQSSAYSPLRPLSINKPLQPAEIVQKMITWSRFLRNFKYEVFFFRFGRLFSFQLYNRDKYPCRRGYCVMTVQWFCSTWRKVADKITWKLMEFIITHIIFVNDPPNPDSRPYVDCLRHKIPRWVPMPQFQSYLQSRSVCMMTWWHQRDGYVW